MRETKVLYVEDDPALRGMMSQLLQNGHSLKVSMAGSSQEALDSAQNADFDAALLDLALGTASATGLELAIALRRLRPNLGIVFYSQHAGTDLRDQLLGRHLESWSVVQKSASVDIGYLAEVLRATARGVSVVDPSLNSGGREPSLGISQLVPRQREIMSHLSAGADAISIAHTLGLSPVTIRQELSKIYKLLVPNPPAGIDLRTTAVVRYLRETQSYVWQDFK